MGANQFSLVKFFGEGNGAKDFGSCCLHLSVRFPSPKHRDRFLSIFPGEKVH